MPYYETVFIARQDLSSTQVEEMTQGFCDIITKDGGKIHKTENWGLRTLAYKINKNRKGHYVMIESDSPASAVLEMERKMRLNEDIMRYMSIREDELSTGPSVMMDRGDRDTSSDRKPYNSDKKPYNKEAA